MTAAASETDVGSAGTASRDGLRVVRIEPAVRPYDWGSVDAIPTMLGFPRTGGPIAELWFGAHPDGPSRLAEADDDRSLEEYIAVLGARALGTGSVARFGPRLPFLLKVLAADRPLSLQVHPNRSQARAGFDWEEHNKIPAAKRNYRDDNHKPEMVCALTDFWALSGFRPVAETRELLHAFGVSALPVWSPSPDSPDWIQATVRTVLTSTPADLGPFIAAVAAGARRCADAGAAWSREARWAVTIADSFPGDPGLLIAILLNLVHLAPGQTLFVPVGQIHGYLRGVSIEIMASSDNVLRCGLTGKHVDSAELLRIADLTAQPVVADDPIGSPTGIQTYRAPVDDFALTRIVVDGRAQSLESADAQIVLCVEGDLAVTAADDVTPLPRGSAAFIPAGLATSITGRGSAFRASVNPEQVRARS